MPALVQVTLLVWVVLEGFLFLRDIVRGKGSTARDRGTRSLLIVGWFAAFAIASYVAWSLRGDQRVHIGRGHLEVGLALMWVGLVIRAWAVAVLGRAFRTTVEVDADQALVDSGPYRWVRHPSYSGILLIAIGYGIALGNWLSLAVLLLITSATMVRRIGVEEAILADVMGPVYVAYQQRTKRLVPGLW